MTTRTEPPFDAGEVESLRSWLGYHRDTLRQKTAGLSAEQLRTPLPSSSLTLGGLLKHLAYVEDNWFGVVLLGRDYVEPWAGADWDADPDWELTSARDDSPEELFGLYDEAVAASERILDDALTERGLDRLSARRVGGVAPCNLRWILVHLIEEYARHNGHADLIREAVDGSVGT